MKIKHAFRPEIQESGRTNTMISIRKEERKDIAAVRTINERAFGDTEEANLTNACRSRSRAPVSVFETCYFS